MWWCTLTFSPVTAEIRSFPNDRDSRNRGELWACPPIHLNRFKKFFSLMQRHTLINRALKPHLLKKPHKSLVHGIEVSSMTKKSIFMLIFWSAHAGLLQSFMKTTDFPLLLINARMLWE